MAAAFLVFAVLGAMRARSLGEAVYFLAVLALLFSAALYDDVHGRIPTMVPVALSALSFGAALFACGPPPSERVFGFCFGLFVPLLVRALWLHSRREEGLGMGDVKLLAALGLLCGVGAIAVLLLGSVFSPCSSWVASFLSSRALFCAKESSPLRLRSALRRRACCSCERALKFIDADKAHDKIC